MARMHADEVDTDACLVRRLLAGQFPRWAGLPVERVASDGTDNALYRLGRELVVRLPRIHWAVPMVEREQRWLPRLARHLPIAIPVPLARGEPAEGYPWPWSVYQWIDGDSPVPGQIADPESLAVDLARFVAAMQRIPAMAGPPAWRSEPLASRDESTRAAIQRLQGTVGLEPLWEQAMRAPAHDGPPVWLHGDLAAGNLVTAGGRLAAVIDFGCTGLGDPAVDLIVAWNVLPAEARPVFRAALGTDDATWVRGRGWALSLALGAIQYYDRTNPPLAAAGRRTVSELRDTAD